MKSLMIIAVIFLLSAISFVTDAQNTKSINIVLALGKNDFKPQTGFPYLNLNGQGFSHKMRLAFNPITLKPGLDYTFNGNVPLTIDTVSSVDLKWESESGNRESIVVRGIVLVPKYLPEELQETQRRLYYLGNDVFTLRSNEWINLPVKPGTPTNAPQSAQSSSLINTPLTGSVSVPAVDKVLDQTSLLGKLKAKIAELEAKIVEYVAKLRIANADLNLCKQQKVLG